MKLKFILNTSLAVALVMGSYLPFASGRTVTTTNKEVSPRGIIINNIHIKEVGSDAPAIGDPYGDGPLSAKADQGPKATQAPYSDDCQESRCVRAKQRQFSSPFWKNL